MRNKEKKLPKSRSVSELILSAVYFLQKKNGVAAKDITKYICHKRGFKQSQMKSKVKEALDRGIKNGIFNLKRGLYKVDETCKRKLTNLKKKVKKKNETNKIKKKLMQKKVSVHKGLLEEKKLTPINETPEKSRVFKARVGSHSLSEDIFDRSGRENSYFEPSLLARPSDEEYDEFDDDDDDNEDDEYSDTDDVDSRDIFTITFADEVSREKFPEFDIYTAAKQTRQKRVSSRRKGRTKSSNGRRGKKRKISKPRRKKSLEENKKSEEVESDDDDYFDEDDSDYSGESEFEKPEKKSKPGVYPEAKKKEEKEKPKVGEVKKNKESTDNKESKEKKESKTNVKKKGKQTTVIVSKKIKKNCCESSEENLMDRNQENPLEKKERNLSKSDCMITSSTKLLPSDFKLSISPNMIVSDVKFSPTTIKFETQDSSMLLLSDTTKNEPADQESLFNDFKVFCECQPPKRKNPTNSDDRSSTRDAEPTQKRNKSKWSQK